MREIYLTTDFTGGRAAKPMATVAAAAVAASIAGLSIHRSALRYNSIYIYSLMSFCIQ